MKLSSIRPNPANPRTIRDEKFAKLKASLEQFPKMMALRPIVVDESCMVLGGNMRLRALQELGYNEVPGEWVKQAGELTDDERRRFIITDNAGFGEWDWDMLANEWDAGDLAEWGLDVPEYWGEEAGAKGSENPYNSNIKAPTYEPKNKKPEIEALYNSDKYSNLIAEIDNSSLPDSEKDFLKVAASRHIVFHYENIADFYAHASEECQLLMESSALIIIDFDKAIEQGYIELREEIANLYGQEYGDEE